MSLFRRTFVAEAPKAEARLTRAKVAATLEAAGFEERKDGWVWEDRKAYLFLDAALRKEDGKIARIDFSVPQSVLRDEDHDERLRKLVSQVAGLVDWNARDEDAGRALPVRTRNDIALEKIDEEKWDEAVALFRDALELDPTSVQAWHGLGVVYERQDLFAEAVPNFKRATELGAGIESWSGYGRNLGDVGKLDEAITVLRKALEKHPKSGRLMVDLANQISEQKKFEEALAILRKAIEDEPTYALAWSNAGYCLNMLGRHEEALPLVQKATEVDPEDGFFVYNLACTYCQLKDADRALETLERAIRMDPTTKEKAPLEPELAWLHDDKRFKKLCR